ncbi:hypothetical protein HYY72_04515 [Candidatus Woesearchaeota archaeon]|nr:hypothetical protein [Candidatus Woesearchaeota archaeon]
MVGKKGFLRTVEVVIAIAMTFIFLIVFIPEYASTKPALKNENALETLYKNPDFRACITSENSTCINQSLSKRLENYDYAFNISKSPDERSTNLPQKRIFSESAFISGNNSAYEPRIMRIYYWGRG